MIRRLVEYLAIVILIGGIVIMILMAGKFRNHKKMETAGKTEGSSELVTPSDLHLSEDTAR
ncbi:MAG: hypothetical protein R3D00_25450 [Bacteroidia bacterium]